MNKYYLLIFAATLTGLASAAVARPLNYTFVSAEYTKYSSAIDGFSGDFEGYGKSLDLSVTVIPRVAITAGYIRTRAHLTLSGTVADADITSTTFGLLAHVPINDTADFIVAISFINGNADVDVDGVFFGRVDRDGGITSIGVRAKPFDTLEVKGFIQKISIEDTSRIGITLGAAYYITRSVSVDLDYSLDEDSDVFALALTKYF